MKNYIRLPLSLILLLVLVSWGTIGHKTVATIAGNHLTPEAKNAVKLLLGNQSIEDIASWADEVRNTPEYRQTGPWHYVDLPLRYTYEQFDQAVKAQGLTNVYGAILKCEDDLRNTTTTQEQKTVALKFLVHFIGDCHQPMHVSRAEDKGGNTIQVQFNGKGMNLHSLWDSGLIGREGLSSDEMSKDYDKATPAEITKWQSDSPMQWIWESYQASTKIYADIEKNNKLDEAYYQANIPVVRQRIEMAGIRLAGVLNDLFKNGIAPSAAPAPIVSQANETPVPLDIKDAAGNIGKTVTISAEVYGTHDTGSMLLVNLGAAYPNQLLTVVLRGNAKDKGKDIDGKMVSVTGKLEDFRGKPEIVITDANNFALTVH